MLVAGLLGLGSASFSCSTAAPVLPSCPVGVWLAGGLLGHDAVLAPLGLLVWAVVAVRLHGPVRRVVGVGLFVAACLVLVALPALGTPGVPDNATTTPRNYALGLAVLLGVDLLVTAAVALAVGRRSARADGAVSVG